MAISVPLPTFSIARRRTWPSRIATGIACSLAVAGMAFVGAPAMAAETPDSIATLATGDALPSLTLTDQHGQPNSIDASTRLVLFTRDMDGGGFVKEVLADDGATALTAADAVYVSDVSGMPGLIRSMFALPSLRRRPYPIVLDEEGLQTTVLPYREGHATILTLDSGRITALSFAASTAEVRAALAP